MENLRPAVFDADDQVPALAGEGRIRPRRPGPARLDSGVLRKLLRGLDPDLDLDRLARIKFPGVGPGSVERHSFRRADARDQPAGDGEMGGPECEATVWSGALCPVHVEGGVGCWRLGGGRRERGMKVPDRHGFLLSARHRSRLADGGESRSRIGNPRLRPGAPGWTAFVVHYMWEADRQGPSHLSSPSLSTARVVRKPHRTSGDSRGRRACRDSPG